MVPITSLYAGLLVLIAIVLTLRVIKERGRVKVSVGMSDDEKFMRTFRAQGNFIETAPIVLIGLLICELNGVAAWWLHLMGAVFVVTRVCHAIGMAYIYPNIPFRLVSTATTGVVFAALTGTLLLMPFLG